MKRVNVARGTVGEEEEKQSQETCVRGFEGVRTPQTLEHSCDWFTTDVQVWRQDSCATSRPPLPGLRAIKVRARV